MNMKEYIVTWLNEMVDKFNWITFRYEYSSILSAHCIEVLPSDSIERDLEYATEEYNFSCKFEDLFGESVIFSDGTESYKCSDNALVFKSKRIGWVNNNNFKIDLNQYLANFYSEKMTNAREVANAYCKGSEYSLRLAA
ncbi:hypothetical protein [Bacteroides reticulotermitis]|uniref:hypothetical protein n=1 Tax=Bacteroides reticulotermitis TaxID=1133319 RepID=UPI003A843FB7